MATVAYYSDWRERQWTCRCGWTGTGDAASCEPFDALLQVDCPACEHRLCLVGYPSPGETRSAAAAGNPEAIRDLANVDRRRGWEARWRGSLLVDPDALPALDDVERIELALQVDEEGEGDARMLLLANGEVIHAELAAFESPEPLQRFLRHARIRYGKRIASVDVATAITYLCGDRIGLLGEVDRILAAHGFDPDGQPLTRSASDHPDPGGTA